MLPLQLAEAGWQRETLQVLISPSVRVGLFPEVQQFSHLQKTKSCKFWVWEEEHCLLKISTVGQVELWGSTLQMLLAASVRIGRKSGLFCEEVAWIWNKKNGI